VTVWVPRGPDKGGARCAPDHDWSTTGQVTGTSRKTEVWVNIVFVGSRYRPSSVTTGAGLVPKAVGAMARQPQQD
jgi:hypothetical protein